MLVITSSTTSVWTKVREPAIGAGCKREIVIIRMIERCSEAILAFGLESLIIESSHECTWVILDSMWLTVELSIVQASSSAPSCHHQEPHGGSSALNTRVSHGSSCESLIVIISRDYRYLCSVTTWNNGFDRGNQGRTGFGNLSKEAKFLGYKRQKPCPWWHIAFEQSHRKIWNMSWCELCCIAGCHQRRNTVRRGESPDLKVNRLMTEPCYVQDK